MLVPCVVSIVHNDGLWQMAQQMSCGVCYHFPKQVDKHFVMDGCNKPKNIQWKARMAAKRVHC